MKDNNNKDNKSNKSNNSDNNKRLDRCGKAFMQRQACMNALMRRCDT